MADLTTQAIGISGAAPTFVAAAGGGDTVAATGRETFIVKNGGGVSVDVTLVVPGNTAYGVAKPDKTYAVPAGEERWIPVLTEYATDGRASVTYSGVSSVTVAVVVR